MLFGCLLAGFEAFAQFSEDYYVVAMPFLNVRSMDLKSIEGKLEDGTKLSSERLKRTGQFATVSGLDGEWLALDDSLRIFDAYLWVAPPPEVDEYGYVETVERYGERVVDGARIPRYYSHYESIGGPFNEGFGFHARCTSSQALRILRRFMLGYLPHAEADLFPSEMEAFRSIMKMEWNGVEPIHFSWGLEGGGVHLQLQQSEEEQGVYVLEWSMSSC